MPFPYFSYYPNQTSSLNFDCIFNDEIATRKVLFEKTFIPKIVITSTPVSVGTRRLRTMWTPELAKDLETYNSIDVERELERTINHNIDNICTRKVLFEKYNPIVWTPELFHNLMAFQHIDAEAELTAILSAQIAAEIDKQIVKDIIVEVTGWNAETRKVMTEKL